MKKIFWISLCLFVLSGCLTYDKKIYTYTINKDGSVDLVIKYENIKSSNVSDTLPADLETDYTELKEKYLDGDALNTDFPNGEIKSKRLFEENGKLCGEVKVKFATTEDAFIYYNKKKEIVVLSFPNANPLMGETIVKSNGIHSEKNSGIIVWERDEKKLTLESTVAGSEQGESLLQTWKKNK